MISNALLLLALLAQPSMDGSRTMRYIGNAGFEISDGTHTILLDFPYVSGAFGYMEFDSSELASRPGSLCLISHAHADHFDTEAIGRVGCQVAGPSEVLDLVPAPSRLKGASPWTFESATATCVESEHGDVEHCTFVLSWHGTTIVAAGDVESVSPLLEVIPTPDVFILPYWLADQSPVLLKAFPGVRIVLSHEEAGAKTKPCDGCERLSQGDSIRW